MGAVFFERKGTTRRSQKDRTIPMGSFLGGNLPGGQKETGLEVRRKYRILPGKHQKTREIILVAPDDIECLNFCFDAVSLTEDAPPFTPL